MNKILKGFEWEECFAMNATVFVYENKVFVGSYYYDVSSLERSIEEGQRLVDLKKEALKKWKKEFNPKE